MKFSILSLLLILFIISCAEDSPDCGDFGEFVNGVCVCDYGYKGENCRTEIREKFIGYWSSNNFKCYDLPLTDANFIISKGEGIMDVLINFSAGSDNFINGICLTDDFINIPLQQDMGGTFKGDIVLFAEDSIEFQITIGVSFESVYCEGEFLKN